MAKYKWQPDIEGGKAHPIRIPTLMVITLANSVRRQHFSREGPWRGQGRRPIPVLDIANES